MPKNRAPRIIDYHGKPVAPTTVYRNGTGGGSSTGDHGLLIGLGDDDHPQYLTVARAAARYLAKTGGTLTGNLDMSGYNILDVGTIDGYNLDTIAGDIDAVEADVATLQARTVLGGNGITSDGVTFGDGSPTLTIDLADIDGDGLGVSGSGLSAELYVKTGNGTEIDADVVGVDLAYDFDWTGNHTHEGILSSQAFATGFGGYGWRVDYGDTTASKATVITDNLTVRNRLSVYELLVRQIRATNGNLFVSAAAKLASVTGSGPYVCTVEGTNGTDYQPFAVGDLVRAQRFTGSGIVQSDLTVTVVSTGSDTRSFTATLAAGSAPAVGYEYVRLGSTSDADRRGGIYLATDDDDAPFIDIFDGVSNWGAWGTADTHKARLGNLSGITDGVLGALTGYGLWSENAYLTGEFTAADGQVAITADGGINIEVSTDAGVYPENSLQFRTDATSTADTSLVSTLMASRVTGGDIQNFAWWSTWYGGATSGSDIGDVWITLYDDGGQVGGKWPGVRISLQSDDTWSGYSGPSAGIEVMDDAGDPGSFHVSAVQVPHEDIIPYVGNSVDLGSAAKPFAELHVTTLYAGTTSSVDTGHNHNDIYYTESEVDALIADLAADDHTHSGMATQAWVTSELADYALDADLTSHTGDATIHRSIDDAGATSTTKLWSSTKISGALAAKADAADLADYALLTDLADYATLAAHDALDATVTTLSSDFDDHVADEDLHHDPVTVGSNLTVTGQLVELGAQVALRNTNNNFSASQSVTGTIAATVNVTAGYDVEASRYIEAAQGALLGATGTPGAMLDVRGDSLLQDVIADDIEADSLTVVDVVFERRSTLVSGGRQRWTPGGAAALRSALALESADPGSIEIELKDPESGHYVQFRPGDLLELRGLQTLDLDTDEEGPAWISQQWPVHMWTPVDPDKSREAVIWMTVDDWPTDDATHFTYTCTPVAGQSIAAGTFAVGTAVAGYNQPTDESPVGYTEMVANDGRRAPYLSAWTIGGDALDHTPIAWFGRLDRVGVANAGEVGIAAGADLDDATAAHFIISQERQRLFGLDFVLEDAEGPIVEITKDNGFRLYANQYFEELDEFSGNTRGERTYVSFVDSSGVVIANIGVQTIWQEYNQHQEFAEKFFAIDIPYYNPSVVLPDVVIDGEGEDTITGNPNLPEGSHFSLRTRTETGDIAAELNMNGPRVELGAEGDFYLSAPLMGISSSATLSISGNRTNLFARTLILQHLPTSAAGLESGQIYSDGGTLKVA